MAIRPYQPGDEANIIALNDTVLKEFGMAFDKILDRDILDIPQYYTKRNGQYFVLVDDSQGGELIVGSIAVSKISNKVCKLRHFYILNEYRKRGFGKQLYEKAVGFIRAAGYNEIWLSTARQFEDAIRFYEHAGFQRSLKPLWHYRRAGIFYILKLV